LKFIAETYSRSTRYCYEVLGMILLQAYLCNYSFRDGSPSKYSPVSAYAISPTMLPLLETIFEILLWKTFSALVPFFFLGCLQNPKIFIPLRQILFLKQP